MLKKHAAVAIITAGIVLTTTGFNSAKPSDSPPPAPKPIVLHEETVISALKSEAHIVGPTGNVKKTVVQEDDTFWGHRDFKMQAKGRYILGVATKDIEVTTVGNTVKVRMPQPEIVALELPYNKIKMIEDNSIFRRDLTEKEKQSLYKEAEVEVRNFIAKNDEVQAKAERQMETAVSGLLLKINGVKSVQFE